MTRLPAPLAPLGLALMAGLLAGVLVGCASPPAALPVAQPPLLDDAFGPPRHPLAVEDVFALSEAMRRHAELELAPRLRRDGLREALLQALYRPGQLKLEYDASVTRTAAEAYDARAGNCLSLVLMTAAFAKHLGLPVGYQAVHVPQSWSKLGDLVVTSGHVNVVLGPGVAGHAARWPDERSGVVVDFLPPEQTRGQRSWAIGEATVLAMLFNNRAAEAVRDGLLDDAYAHARNAVLQDPSYAPAVNTLAVVYQRRGRPAAAEAVLRELLQREPDNLLALANLEPMVRRRGDAAEADRLARRRAAIEPQPPFHWHDVGLAALDRGDLVAARDAFARELARASGQAETHHAMAATLAALGDADGARRHLEAARRHGTTEAERARYGAKLLWLAEHAGPARSAGPVRR